MNNFFGKVKVNGQTLTPSLFMNMVRLSVPAGYERPIPLAEAGQTSFTNIGTAVTATTDFRNLWHQTAINLVAKILMNNNIVVNPLAEFEGELVANGAFIEEMIIDTAKTFMFNPARAEVNLFKRRAPELYAVMHKSTRDVTNSITLQDTWLRQCA